MVEKLLKCTSYSFTQKLAKKNSKIPNYKIDNSIIQNQNSDMKLFYPKIRWNFEYNKQLLVYIVANNSVVVELWWAAELIYIQIDRCLHWARTLTRPIIFTGICGRMGHYGRYEIGNIS